MKRSEVEKKYLWHTEDIYPSTGEWEKDLKYIADNSDLSSYENRLGDPKVLLEYLRKQDEIMKVIEKVYCYAMLLHDTDLSNPDYDSMMARVRGLLVKFDASTSFVVPELTALSDEQLLSLVKNPDFSDYDYMLSGIIKDKKHVLGKEAENVIALGGEVYGQFQDAFMKIDNADLPMPEIDDGKGGKIKLSHGVYGLLMQDKDRDLRERTFKAYYKSYMDFTNTITSVYNGSVKKDVFLARVRKYDSCLDKALSGEDVVPEVYTNLINAVHDGFPVMHEYIKEKKKALGLDEMHMYDMYVPVVENADISVSYEEACEIVLKGLKPLGEEYQTLLKKAMTEGWIDVCETENKRSGAYSMGVHGVHPFVLLNYQPTTHDVFTIAHELGHSMHSYFSSKNQPYAKADYKIFVAEVASTVNEMLLVMHLLKTEKDEKVKKYILSYLMEMIRTTLFRQTQFAEFEYIAHDMCEKGMPLTTKALNEKYLELNKAYYGDGVVSDDEIAYEWSRIPHFYTAFYVYKYATGIISAMAIVNRILTEGEKAVKDYFAFLSSGGSDNPVNLLKIAGVDLTKKEPFDKAMELFKNTLAEFKALN